MPLKAQAAVARQAGFTAALSRVWYWALLVGAYSALPAAIGSSVWLERFEPSGMLDAVLGFILGMFLVFRINRAYERWWEARTLWGKLVNVSRNLAIKAKTFANLDEAERTRLRGWIVGFCYALKGHLRGEGSLSRVPGFEHATDDPRHVPAFLADQIYQDLKQWHMAGRVSDGEQWLIDREARELLEVAGGCERIANTLMAQSFPALVHQALVLYLLYLPWSIADDFGLLTIPIITVVAYFTVSAEGIAHYVERPFGTEDDHLDLAALCDGIDRSVTEILNR